MTTYYLNGNALPEGANFTLNGMTYPYSWLEGTSPSVRASLGIEKDGDINFDPTYYWNADTPKNLDDTEDVDVDGNPLYVQVWDSETLTMVNTSVRRVTKGLKTTCTSSIKSITNSLLTPTDFYVLRNEVEQLEIPETVSTYRAAVISEKERVVAGIATATTVEELIAVMKSIAWPEAK